MCALSHLHDVDRRASLGLMFTNRSWSRGLLPSIRMPNSALWWVTGGTLAVLGLVLYVLLLRDLFRFSTLHGIDLAICLAAGLASVLWFEVLKWGNRAPFRPMQVSQ